MKSASYSKRSVLTFLFLIAVTESRAGVRESQADTVVFTSTELLGRATNTSIAVMLCAAKDIDAYIEYGTSSGAYLQHSSTVAYTGGTPFTVMLGNLNHSTRYYYRVRYRSVGGVEYLSRPEYTFQTARLKGNEFSFAIEADPHMDVATNPILLRRTITNILSGGSDFMIDLGDTFMSEKLQHPTQDSIIIRYLLLRSLFESACHSVPLYLVVGNHEGELGWLLDQTASNVAVLTSNTRKRYFPNPAPDYFYSGDTTNVKYIGQRQNYYAWEWGNALFVVLDAYWYTAVKPGSTQNNWAWTLGRTQYDWFKKTLETSKAGFKFVFAHQIIGGVDTEGRGGIEGVPYYEMGGQNADGTWGFSANRPGWPIPVHQLMVNNKVSAYFHGHDHVYVKQDLDGIVYQELPQPGYYNFISPDKSYSSIALAAQYGYTHGTILPSSGYLRVTVRDTESVVDYVRTYMPEHENTQRVNGSIAFSYTIKKSSGSTSADGGSVGPDRFSLRQNYPNPFNPGTTFEYQLPNAERVRLSVLDVLGCEIAVVVDQVMTSGLHRVSWDGTRYPSGVYFYRLAAGNFRQTKTMCIIK